MPDRTEDDACDLLDADHLAVKHLFVEYARLAYAAAPAARFPVAKAGGDAAPDEVEDDRSRIAASICDELTLHASIEEEVFYPALRQAVPDANDVLDDAMDEHAQARALIAQIRQQGRADPALDRLVADLARAVEDHVKEERDELFPKARAAEGLDLAELGTRLRQRQQQGTAADPATPA